VFVSVYFSLQLGCIHNLLVEVHQSVNTGSGALYVPSNVCVLPASVHHIFVNLKPLHLLKYVEYTAQVLMA
jgi:hypothetical protein